MPLAAWPHLVSAHNVVDVLLLQLLGIQGIDQEGCPGFPGVIQICDLQMGTGAQIHFEFLQWGVSQLLVYTEKVT